MIQVTGLEKRFGNGRGIFDLNFQVKQGEVYGYLGPNGAGKSTTIRHLMGFLKPSRGHARIGGLDCWRDAAEVQKKVGYLPGEIAFLDGINGAEFLDLLAGMRGLKSKARREELIERFQFDSKTPIRKMSKGMKQKVGLVAAFMHDPAVLILDEPTSGLDPLMQKLFVELLLEEKEKGTTILISSHMFQEIERTADRVGIIKDGVLIAEENVHDLQARQKRIIEVTLASAAEADRLAQSGLAVADRHGNRVGIAVQGEYQHLFQTLGGYAITGVDVRTLDLEELFMHYYDRNDHMGGKEGVR
ncbi:ABC transporter ATP-binding protein [Tumebacillus sp. DT12]|uniref:ABC transporter ATP-binding protein n=1 Tax=Tumebacillus lacus TaxID=2995335 RepID=A0ABT3X573_9BACL|nr:ABC transporter ATP-binding protein [Tumebacillus lacus]MCX7570997.1 ABC transporter ATP-binding protein [Tumebacillus lacus]